jgi:hypothetical protein
VVKNPPEISKKVGDRKIRKNRIHGISETRENLVFCSEKSAICGFFNNLWRLTASIATCVM